MKTWSHKCAGEEPEVDSDSREGGPATNKRWTNRFIFITAGSAYTVAGYILHISAYIYLLSLLLFITIIYTDIYIYRYIYIIYTYVGLLVDPGSWDMQFFNEQGNDDCRQSDLGKMIPES